MKITGDDRSRKLGDVQLLAPTPPFVVWCVLSLKRHVGALGAGATSRAALVCQVPTPGNTWGKLAWTGSTCQKLQHLNCLLLIRPVTIGWGSIPASMHLLGAHLASSSPPVVSRWSSTMQTCHWYCSALSFVPQRNWRFLEVPHKILCHWYWPETSRFPCLEQKSCVFLTVSSKLPMVLQADPRFGLAFEMLISERLW